MKQHFSKMQSIAFLTVLLLFVSSFPSFAATKSVKVTTPNFPVSLNGFLTSEEEYYPLLVYKNITYIPLSQKMAELLNLHVSWNPISGALQIHTNPTVSTSLSAPGFPSDQKITNFTATVANYPIFVNGKPLDLQKETYPVLNFRNITYFPLTWRFAVNEFNWQYQFDTKEGLKIYSPNYNPEALPHQKSLGDSDTPLNDNPEKLTVLNEEKSLKMPVDAFQEPFFYKNGNIFYFVNNTNSIDFWRQALHGKPEKIGSTPISGKEQTGYHYLRLYSNQDLMFTSHFGGPTMGNETHYLLPDNGNATVFSDERYHFLQSYTGGYVGSIFTAAGPTTGFVKLEQNGNRKSMGLEDHYYAKGKVDGNTLYALVQSVLSSSTIQAGTKLYQIDLTDGKHTKVLDRVYDYALAGNKIYYRESDESKDIFCFDKTTGKTEKKIALFEKFHDFSVMGDTLFTLIPLPEKDGKEPIYNIYRNENGNWQLIAKEVEKPLFSPSHLTYLQTSGKKSNPSKTLVLTDNKGIAQTKILAGQTQVDYFLNGSELILWSWQDQMVRYFKLK